MSIYKSELLKSHIDLSRILVITDATFIDRMGNGGWFVGFDILFQLQDSPLKFQRELSEERRELRYNERYELGYLVDELVVYGEAAFTNTPNPPILAVVNLQKEIDQLVAVWKEAAQGIDPERAALERKVAELERMRPLWAQGYSSDGVAAQVTGAALTQLWGMLGAKDQTDAVRALNLLLSRVQPPRA